ncbi:helix-turn-helix transcriptional regulator [candidate division KSB1 bacterium]|nr:helix-turn-helix transcriptional regulator [candidate division KSB1 bacterium]
MILSERNHLSESSNFIHAGVLGGAIGGLIMAFVMIIVKWIFGFGNIPITITSVKILFVGIASGGLTGWVFSYYVKTSNRLNLNFTGRVLAKISVFIAGFIIVTLTHQLAAKDALHKINTYMRFDETGQVYYGGGPLGEPSFEMIACGLLGSVFFLFLANGLSRMRSPNDKVLSYIISYSALIGMLAWSSVYILYEIMLNFGIIQFNVAPFGTRAYFVTNFTNPARIFIYVIIAIIYDVAMITTISKMVKPENNELQPRDQEFLDRIDRIIEEEMSDHNFGPTRLAERIYLSKEHLNRRINKLTGQSTTVYIRSVKLYHAANLLEQGYGNVSQVADRVGFSDINYFSRCFKELFKVSPKEYPKHPTSHTNHGLSSFDLE